MSPVFSLANLIPIVLFALAILSAVMSVVSLAMTVRSFLKKRTTVAWIWLAVLLVCVLLCILVVTGNLV